MPPPFNINETSPASNAVISAFPADEQANRAEIEEWLTFISDPATGMIRESVLPATDVFPSGTKMLFQQTSAPTGWTKDTTHNNKALRLVNGTVGTGGTTAFTTVFASRTPTGSNAATTATGTNSSTAVSIDNTTATGTVGATALTTAQLPAHTHSSGSLAGTAASAGAHTHTVPFAVTGSGGPMQVVDNNGTQSDTETTSSAGAHTHTVDVNSGSTGSTGTDATHTHSFTGTAHNHTSPTHTHTFTGTSHNHTWTGVAMDFAVQYVDFIIATAD